MPNQGFIEKLRRFRSFIDEVIVAEESGREYTITLDSVEYKNPENAFCITNHHKINFKLREFWVNAYKSGYGSLHTSQTEADSQFRSHERIELLHLVEKDSTPGS